MSNLQNNDVDLSIYTESQLLQFVLEILINGLGPANILTENQYLDLLYINEELKRRERV
jgi:hypothetical protein